MTNAEAIFILRKMWLCELPSPANYEVMLASAQAVMELNRIAILEAQLAAMTARAEKAEEINNTCDSDDERDRAAYMAAVRKALGRQDVDSIHEGIDALAVERDAKKGRTPPPGFIPAMEPDEVTGHTTGWLEVGTGPEDQWFRAALASLGFVPPDGTYEACGPHFNANPEGCERDTLVRHGMIEITFLPRDFHGIKEALAPLDIEGVVFWHPDGRMAKVKKKDFGLRRQL